jgi:ubiquinone/menaquinone biosynthesis C-methylase UbiE
MSDEEYELPAPFVPPDVYDEEYFRHGCAGSQDWDASGGHIIAGMYPGVLELAGMQPGDVVVDVGTGRGELVAAAAEMGAERAIGFDYSETAIALARQTLIAREVTKRAEVHVVDARRLPLEDDSADLVTLLDVVEHLSSAELDAVLSECLRILQPGGHLFVHTMPNRVFYDVTYRIHRAIARVFGQRLPVEPRNEYELLMHVNEQTVGSLRGTLKRAGFSSVDVHVGDFLHLELFPRGGRIYRKARQIPGLRRLAVNDRREPRGWFPPGSTVDGALREGDLRAGGSLYREGTAIRGALDAALSSPSSLGVVVDDAGRAVGVVTAHQVLEVIENHPEASRSS